MYDEKEKLEEVKEEVKQPEEKTPCAEHDTACTRRWIDSLSDCA
jgi:hypothetical protein